MYTDPACKPWTSRQWAPPGFTSRRDLIEQIRAAESNKPLASDKTADEHIEKAGTNAEVGNPDRKAENV